MASKKGVNKIPFLDSIQEKGFWSKVDVLNKNECWNWLGAKNTKGYGNVRINKKYFKSHRIAFVIDNKIEIPNGLIVCHICDNPSCCNPNHLMLGNYKSNAIDMVIKNRCKNKETSAKGSHNGNSKITEQDAKEIKSLFASSALTQRQIAKKFNVTQTTISCIKSGKTWSHV